MARKKHVDNRPRAPTPQEIEEYKQSTTKQKTSVRLDPLSLKQLEIIGIASGQTRSQLIQIAVNEYANRETQKKLTLELEAKQKAEVEKRDTKGAQIEAAFMKKLLFDTGSSFGWSEASV